MLRCGARTGARLRRVLQRLEIFEIIWVSDRGDVQQSADEAEVLFTLLAEGYERRSWSHLASSQEEGIFGDQMAMAAAFNRLVHAAGVI